MDKQQIEKCISGVIGTVVLVVIGIVVGFVILPSFSSPESPWVVRLLPLIFLLSSLFLSAVYWGILYDTRGKRGS